LHAGGISPRRVERTAAIEANLADTGLAFGNRAAMAAGKTSDAVVFEFLVENWISFANSLIEDVAQGGQRNLLRIL
jgi:hypothetical protein